MSYGFGKDKVQEKNKVYLKEAGLHTNARFLSLTYDATPEYEFFDIEIETADGRYFRERTFGPDKDKVYPKALYKGGQKVGEETKEQAFERVTNELNMKLFYLATCFCDKDVLASKVANATTLKEFVTAVNKAIGEPTTNINILTVWKNSEARQKSNLIIAERIKWCEPYNAEKSATIRLNKWQLENQTVEKYPYRAESNEATNTNDALIEQPAGEQLPF